MNLPQIAQHDPDLEQLAATSLPPQVERCLVPRYSNDHELLAFLVEGELEPDQVTDAIAILDQLLEPATQPEIIKAITQLYSLVAPSPGDSQATLELRIAAYADRLAQYPRDAVLKVMHQAADKYRWFPAWSDLKKELDHASKQRQLRRQALELTQLRSNQVIAGAIRRA